MTFYKKVAVLSFTTMGGDAMSGPRVTRAFITELIMTDRYQIVQPEEFRGALSKVSGLPGPDGLYDPASCGRRPDSSARPGSCAAPSRSTRCSAPAAGRPRPWRSTSS